jgi:hypothetical protein
MTGLDQSLLEVHPHLAVQAPPVHQQHGRTGAVGGIAKTTA